MAVKKRSTTRRARRSNPKTKRRTTRRRTRRRANPKMLGTDVKKLVPVAAGVTAGAVLGDRIVAYVDQMLLSRLPAGAVRGLGFTAGALATVALGNKGERKFKNLPVAPFAYVVAGIMGLGAAQQFGLRAAVPPPTGGAAGTRRRRRNPMPSPMVELGGSMSGSIMRVDPNMSGTIHQLGPGQNIGQMAYTSAFAQPV